MEFSYVISGNTGDVFARQFQLIQQAGCRGVEVLLLPNTPIDRWQAELQRAAADHGLAVAAVIIGGLALFQPEQSQYINEAMSAAHELGAGVLITPEYRPTDPLPLQPPYSEPHASEKAKVAEALTEISASASRLGQPVYFEPITQFQSRFWHNTRTVLQACRRLDNPLIGLALDFWVMNITEASIPDTIRAVGQSAHHVHLSDNNRLLPGHGHINFASGLQALKDVSYEGWYSFECAVEGDFVNQISASIRWLRECANGQRTIVEG